MVARSLKNLVGEIRIVSFPDVKERGDVTDWINAGHAKDELMARCKSSPVFAEENRYQKPFNAADLETKEFAAVSMIIEGILPEGLPASSLSSRMKIVLRPINHEANSGCYTLEPPGFVVATSPSSRSVRQSFSPSGMNIGSSSGAAISAGN